jgi:hypothetical protein
MEVADLSYDIGDLRVGDNADILMSSGVHEFWGKDAHRTVVCWECFIKLCHRTADG